MSTVELEDLMGLNFRLLNAQPRRQSQQTARLHTCPCTSRAVLVVFIWKIPGSGPQTTTLIPQTGTQISIYTGRGMLIEASTVWL